MTHLDIKAHLELLSILCHVGVLISRAGIFGAAAWALVYSRPARISFLAQLPRQMQPVVADLFATAWSFVALMLFGGFGSVGRYLSPEFGLAMTALNAGAGCALGIHLFRLALKLPKYMRGRV